MSKIVYACQQAFAGYNKELFEAMQANPKLPGFVSKLQLSFRLFLIFLNFQVSICYNILQTLGTASDPFIHNLISSQQTCRIHLAFNELTTENLENTQNIAVTLSKLPINTPLNARVPLNPFKNRGWICELLFFYVKTSSAAFI